MPVTKEISNLFLRHGIDPYTPENMRLIVDLMRQCYDHADDAVRDALTYTGTLKYVTKEDTCATMPEHDKDRV
jgi:hypothetical protein